MTRKDFFTRTLAGILASVGLSKVAMSKNDKPKYFDLDERIYLQCQRDWYRVNDEGVSFHKGTLSTDDPEIIRFLSNNPFCKKK
jgi:hypothetical protein